MMKRSIVTALSLIVILWLAGSSAWAQGRGGGGGRGPGGGPGGAGMPHGPSASGNSASGNSSSAHSSNASSNSSPGEVLSHNTKLDGKLTSKLQAKGLLPQGTDLKTACDGFRNLGQCMAAIHVSHNLDVPFGCFKADMTANPAAASGLTCPGPAGIGTGKAMTLGKTIQTLSPNANSKTESKKGMKDADLDIKDSESESKP
ncbi:MAG TPA: hypothetical protein VEU31_10990 [Candidatus Acidoferrales bacterium]|nr:hypothetical protein [Candidatus Acidoferrales bacterium]